MRRERAYRFRIYPDAGQERLLRRTVGSCRLVYNLALEQRRAFGRRGRSITYNSAANELKDLKVEAEFLREVPHHCLQQALRDLDTAFVNFFEGRAAYPKPRKKFQRESCRFPDMAQVVIGRRVLRLPKLGAVKTVMHRPLRGKLNSITIAKDGGQWFAAVQVTGRVKEPAARAVAEVGVDQNIVSGIVTSESEFLAMPRTSEAEQRKLSRLQKAHARKKRGSKNRDRSRRAIEAFHAKIRRRRRDGAEKASRRLADAYTHIAMEKLALGNMTASAAGTVEEPGRMVAQKAGLNRALLDVAPGLVRRLTTYKAAWAGGVCVAVDPRYTSQRCSRCGKHPQDDEATKDLPHGRISRDEFVCPLCGFKCHADVNAARNILALGRVIWTANDNAVGTSASACGGLRGRRAGKQEQRSRQKAA